MSSSQISNPPSTSSSSPLSSNLLKVLTRSGLAPGASTKSTVWKGFGPGGGGGAFMPFGGREVADGKGMAPPEGDWGGPSALKLLVLLGGTNEGGGGALIPGGGEFDAGCDPAVAFPNLGAGRRRRWWRRQRAYRRASERPSRGPFCTRGTSRLGPGEGTGGRGQWEGVGKAEGSGCGCGGGSSSVSGSSPGGWPPRFIFLL